MGYVIEQVEAQFSIAPEHEAAALAAIKALAGRETCHDGSGAHFRYVSGSYLTATKLDTALGDWRWLLERSWDDIYITGIAFAGENLGDDAILFAALAPYVTAGSFIHMVGEDGEHWRWVFTDGACVEQQATLVWEAAQ